MKEIRPEDLGGVGESFFKSLCKSVGLVANKSDDDKAGWDFELEHPRLGPIDYGTQASPVYRVQVKSTTSTSPSVSVSYNNLLNLIHYPGASFITLLMYGGGLAPQSMYMLHVDKQLASAIWKEIRKKQIKYLGFSLHKRKRRIGFDNSQRLAAITGDALKAALAAYTGKNYLEYVEEKSIWLKGLAKEAQTKVFQFGFKNEAELEAMAKCLLGYDESFEVDVRSFNAPFGIPDESPYHTIEDHRTTITPTTEELERVTVYLQGSATGASYKFQGVVYYVPKEVPLLQPRMRISTSVFDMVMTDQGLSMELGKAWTAGNMIAVRDLADYMRCLSFAAREKKLWFKIEREEQENPLEMTLPLEACEFPTDLFAISEALNATVIRFRELNVDDHRINAKDVWDRTESFSLYKIVEQEYRPTHDMSFEATDSADTENIDTVLFKNPIALEDVTVVGFVAFFGRVSRIRPGVFHGIFTSSELMGLHVIPRGLSLAHT